VIADVAEDRRNRTHAERIVSWDGYVVLASLLGGQPHVAAGLARRRVAQGCEDVSKVIPGGPAGASYSEQSIPYEMESDNPRTVGMIFIMAKHRVAQLSLQGLEVVCLCEDGHAQRACRIPAFWRFLDYEDNLVHVMTSEVGGPAAPLYS